MEVHKNKVFVMGDIHGAYQALIQCLVRFNFDYENDILIQLGDVVDGNPEVYECVEELLKIKNLIAIKGNHDVWFGQFLETDFQPVAWNFGGLNTIESYLKHCQPKGKIIKSGKGYKTSMNSNDFPANHKAFFKNQKLYYVDDKNQCFVHAGFDDTKPFYEQEETNYYFDRSLWIESIQLQKQKLPIQRLAKFSQIFIGHTPTLNFGYSIPMLAQNIWNLDTGAGKGGKLSIMDINTNEYWQSDKIYY